jgi:hypothetical protein
MISDLVPSDVFDRLPERYRQRAREISKRVSEIETTLTACDTADVRDAAGRLRGQLRPQPETDLAKFAGEFKLACSDLPAWAVSEATNDFLSGRVENHTGQFMPTCAEFARHAREIIRPFLAERASLRVEASRLFERAEDDRRRDMIAIERADPAVKDRIKELTRQVTSGTSVASKSHPHSGVDPEMQAKLDALKKRRPEPPSRITQTRIVSGK